MALAHEVTNDLKSPVPHGPFDRYDDYAEMVAEMDRAVGRLVAALNALQLREKTLVLFLADNGTPPEIIIRAEGSDLITTPVVSRRNGMDVPGGKKQLNDAGTNVPMIANWPGTIQSGQIIDDLVDFSDVLPTFLDLAGQALPSDHKIDGFSFASRLRGQGASRRSFAYSEGADAGGVKPDGISSGLKWVRTQEWKLYNDGRLYHMLEDPSEQHALHAKQDESTRTNIRRHLQGVLRSLGF